MPQTIWPSWKFLETTGWFPWSKKKTYPSRWCHLMWRHNNQIFWPNKCIIKSCLFNMDAMEVFFLITSYYVLFSSLNLPTQHPFIRAKTLNTPSCFATKCASIPIVRQFIKITALGSIMQRSSFWFYLENARLLNILHICSYHLETRKASLRCFECNLFRRSMCFNHLQRLLTSERWDVYFQ